MQFAERKYQNARPACQPDWPPLVDSLLNLMVPVRCLLCREPAWGLDLCPECLDDLPWLGRCCRCCGLPLADADAARCGACRLAPRAVPDLAVAALIYEFPVDRLIARFKYSRQLQVGRMLAELLSIRVHELSATAGYELPDLLLPVPLHPWRLLQRGFNQAEEIAAQVASAHGLRLSCSVIRRITNTPRQTGQNRRARLRNMRGAFAVSRNLAGCRVAIIDDVVTSAATATELTATLRQAGADEVQVWSVARTVE